MKFIDEVDIELVNQELNFQSPDNNLIIKGGCDLFTTKAIGSDRKLFKTIDKHLDQIMEDQQLSQSIERERKQSVSSLFGSSASPQQPNFLRRGSFINELFDKERTLSNHLLTFSRSEETLADGKTPVFKNISSPILEGTSEEYAIDDSPFGPLKNASTRKTFAYLIAILNATYPDHDFSNLQPSTENFYRIESSESLRHRFNSIMVSLGKKEDLLSWIWDTINSYMDVTPRSPSLAAQGSGSRKIVSTTRARLVRQDRLTPAFSPTTPRARYMNSSHQTSRFWRTCTTPTRRYGPIIGSFTIRKRSGFASST